MSADIRFVETPPGEHDGVLLDGRFLRLDRLPDTPRLSASIVPYREAYPLIPEPKWQDVDLYEAADPPVLSQVQNGCVGHGGSTTFTLAWWQSGQETVAFSPTWLYALTNGGRDQGAMIGDLIGAAQKYGVCPEPDFPESDYFAGRATAADYEAARRYLLGDAYSISTYEELGSALSEGYPVADSVMVGRTFMDLDADGVVGVDRGPGNHCTSAGGIRTVRGRRLVLCQNSWGTRFGLNGRFAKTRDHVLCQGQYSGVVFRSVKLAPGTAFPVPALA